MLDNPKTLPFSEGQCAHYPAYGVVTVAGIEEVPVSGEKVTVYRLNLRDGNSIKVPVAKAEQNGLRPIAEAGRVKEIIATLKNTPQKESGIWQRRAAHYKEKLDSGDLVKIAEVIRDLHTEVGKSGKPITIYQALYQQAFDFLLSETALILGKTETETLSYISQESGKSFNPDFGRSAGAFVAGICTAKYGKAKISTGNDVRSPRPAAASKKEEPAVRAASSPPSRKSSKRGEQGASRQKKVRELQFEIAHLRVSLKTAHATLNDLRGELAAREESHKTEVDGLRQALRDAIHNRDTALLGLRDAQAEIARLRRELADAHARAQDPSRKVARPKKTKGSGLQLQRDGTLWNPDWG